MTRASHPTGPKRDKPTATIESGRAGGASLAPVPGLLLVFSAGQPMLQALAVRRELELGRAAGPFYLDDATISRRHARVARDGQRWRVTDVGSRNGVRVDGTRIGGEALLERPRVLRLGESVFLFRDDVRELEGAAVETAGDRVMGPTLRRVWQAIATAARVGDTLHITGESGSGKELAARAFHDLGPRAAGPFVPVNCAAVPEGLAERLLFGARRGAFSGAVEHAAGYVQAADGGTLFLDEIAEIDPAVQAKLLRLLETREVTALGEARPRRVDVGICTATHRDLRAWVARKQFREDLYYRVGQPTIAMPPLRERLEEIPWLLDRELRKIGPELRADASFVEACLLRDWPGNVRELLAGLREAARVALTERVEVLIDHLLPAATGLSIAGAPAPRGRGRGMPPRAVLEATLRRTGGRLATSARELGVHRTQLRRWLLRLQIDPRNFSAPGGEKDDE